jgi:hypothetical protein
LSESSVFANRQVHNCERSYKYFRDLTTQILRRPQKLSALLPWESLRDTPGSADSVVRFATDNLFENFKIGDDLLAGREYFFDHFTAPMPISFGAAAAPPSWR